MSDIKELKLNVKVNGKNTEFACPFTTEVVDKFHTKYNFVIEGELRSAMEMEVYFKTKNRYKVMGFRNGKAPKHTIEQFYGKGVWIEDTVDMALEACYNGLLKQVLADEALVASPEYSVDKVELDKYTFSFTACVMPEIVVENYTGLDVEKVAPVEVTDADVDKALDSERDKLACWEEVTDRPVANGDSVNIDYSGSVDGVKFDGGTAEKQDLVIGSGTFIPGFEDQIIGMNIGEDRDITVTFPENYGAENLAGKEAVFAIKLHEIKVKVLPELDDEFAKDASDDCDTLEELKAKLRRELEEKAVKNAENATEGKLVDKLLENNPIEFPEEYYDFIAENAIRQEMQQQGIPVDLYLKYVKTTMEEMVKSYKEGDNFKYAIENEKVRLIMTAIVKKENITAEESDVEAKIADYAEKAEKSVEDYKKEMREGEDRYIANVVVNDKLRKFLLDNNNIK